ncbi:ubiquitin-conjugating enzyme E2 [Aspergillus stella-maris]|uniref:ubiquitin-conjugating enzyme E2 n=1 Tax=Aspergillus stella-maris TaxID=1810926 RepID=UPI003CCD0A0C
MFASKRLSKELLKIKEHLPPGISLVKAENLENWEMDIKVLDDNPLYRNETYRLKFTFGSKYPIEPPEVQFITDAQSSASSQSKPSQPPPHQQQQQQQQQPTAWVINNGVTYSSTPTPAPSNPPSNPLSTSTPTTSTDPNPTARPIPIHPHIYSNGIICLDLLSSAGWSPVQTVESVCMSIQSMLTANSKNERPPGDSEFVSYNRRRPRDINFLYDDDDV